MLEVGWPTYWKRVGQQVGNVSADASAVNGRRLRGLSADAFERLKNRFSTMLRCHRKESELSQEQVTSSLRLSKTVLAENC